MSIRNTIPVILRFICVFVFIVFCWSDNAYAQKAPYLSSFYWKNIHQLQNSGVDTILIYTAGSYNAEKANSETDSGKGYIKMLLWVKNGITYKRVCNCSDSLGAIQSINDSAIRFFFSNKGSLKKEKKNTTRYFWTTSRVWINPSANIYSIDLYYSGKWYTQVLTDAEYHVPEKVFKYTFKEQLHLYHILGKEAKE